MILKKFQDHASRYVYAHLQESTTAQETLKRICRYLLKTKERGIVINPNEECQLKCFVDADFAGLWKVEDPEDKRVQLRELVSFLPTLEFLLRDFPRCNHSLHFPRLKLNAWRFVNL